jgi:di/tricarboxylate transporter
MTFQIGFLFVLLAAMVYLFLTEKIPVDLTAFAGLVILILAGYLTPEEAFTGFASSAVITMLSVFIVGAAMLHTGIADIVGQQVHAWVGNREIPLVITIMIVAAVLSAFMNNIAATAVLMPAVAAIARQARISPSRLFMPLAYGAILGGTTTLVGTPPNILAAAMLEERGLEPFGLFDFTPVGVSLLLCGIVFMLTVGRKLLPERDAGPALAEETDLAQVYQLHERLFSMMIPLQSGLDGMTLAAAQLESTLGVQVVAITRGGEKMLAPEAATVLRGGDVLLVKGRLSDLKELLRVQGVQVRKAQSGEIPRPIKGVSGVRATVSRDAGVIGRTLKELRFREQYGAVVIGIQRGQEILRIRLAEVPLQEGDSILAVGPRVKLEKICQGGDFGACEVGLTTLQQLQSHLYVIRILDDSPLAGRSVEQSRIGELAGVTVAGIIRGEDKLLIASPDEMILEGDRLLMAGEPSTIVRLLEMGSLSLESKVVEPALESEEIGVMEATLAPRSSVAGKTLGELSFRDRYGLQVLAVWREGGLLRTSLAKLRLRFGDALLLQGPRNKLTQLASDQDFVVLSEKSQIARRTRKAPFALLALGLMVGFVATGFQPIQVAAFTAATFAVLTGAIRMEEAYRAIEWRAIFLVAAVLPVGIAMERTGAALMLAQNVTDIAGPFGPYAVLAAMVVLSSLVSQGLDGAPAVVLLTPVVIQATEQLGLSPYPIMMGVGLAASAAFMTPFSHKANLLVMGAGGYRSMDYLKVGTPLTVLLVILMVLLIPVFFPF